MDSTNKAAWMIVRFKKQEQQMTYGDRFVISLLLGYFSEYYGHITLSYVISAFTVYYLIAAISQAISSFILDDKK